MIKGRLPQVKANLGKGWLPCNWVTSLRDGENVTQNQQVGIVTFKDPGIK